jgi:hypothetical protein
VVHLAERCGLLSGQEDDFIMIILTAYTGMRWGEVMGLERPYCRLGQIQIDWQLREFAGRLEKSPPKDESYRAVDLPPFLAGLVSRQVERAGRCACGDLDPACGACSTCSSAPTPDTTGAATTHGGSSTRRPRPLPAAEQATGPARPGGPDAVAGNATAALAGRTRQILQPTPWTGT